MTNATITLIVLLPFCVFPAEVAPIPGAVQVTLLTNVWVTDGTYTPNFRGQSNYNSTTFHLQSAEWVTRKIHITLTDEGEKIETVVKQIPTNVTRGDTPYVPGQPFWYDGVMWQWIPTNMPPPLGRRLLEVLRNRQDATPAPVPPLPR